MKIVGIECGGIVRPCPVEEGHRSYPIAVLHQAQRLIYAGLKGRLHYREQEHQRDEHAQSVYDDRGAEEST